MDLPTVARLRLANQRLRGKRLAGPVEVVRHLGAVQAQEYPNCRWGIAQRCATTPDAIDALVSDGSLIRTHVLRPTWHLVAREDARDLLALTGPRVLHASERRLAELQLDRRTVDRAVKVLAQTLADGRARSRPDLADVLRRRRIDPDGQRMPYLLMVAELEMVVASGPRVGKHHGYLLFDRQVPARRAAFDREAAVRDLAARYFGSHGPMALKDWAWWSGLTGADGRRALEELGDDFETVDADGVELVAPAPVRTPRRPSRPLAHLLPTYDEFLGSANGRWPSMVRLPGLAPTAFQIGASLATIDGQVIGTWRPQRRSTEVDVVVTAMTDLSGAERQALEREAGVYAGFWGLDLGGFTIAPG